MMIMQIFSAGKHAFFSIFKRFCKKFHKNSQFAKKSAFTEKTAFMREVIAKVNQKKIEKRPLMK